MKSDPVLMALTALAQVSFYARINHANFKDYGEVADEALLALGVPTGEYLGPAQVKKIVGSRLKED